MINSPESLPRMNPNQYLSFERAQEIRHELIDGYLYGMVGASDRHEEIALNLAAALQRHLRGGPCRTYKGDMKLRIGDDFYYPDVFVRCSESRGDPYFKTDPIMVAEVLSPSTQRYDRGDKRQAYLGLKSLQEYILISQTEVHVEVVRSAESSSTVLRSTQDALVLDSLEFSITLEELYS